MDFYEDKGRFEKTTKSNPCPICGKHGWCMFNPENGDTLCHKKPSEIENPGGGWLHRNSDNTYTKPPMPTKKAKKEELEPNSIEVDSMIYHKFYDYLTLNSKDREYLVKAGFTNEDLKLCLSGTKEEVSNAVKKIATEVGADIAIRNPAFSIGKSQYGEFWKIATSNFVYNETLKKNEFGNADGIWFPAIDEYTGLISGFQNRFYEPLDAKYKWISKGSIGTPIAVLKSVNCGDPLKTLKIENSLITVISEFLKNEAKGGVATFLKILVITEGFKKAVVIKNKLGCDAMALAGVGSYKIEEVLSKVDQVGYDVIVLAFDADKATNKSVLAQEQRLIDSLATNYSDKPIYTAEWDLAQGKGIDDALLAGAGITFRGAILSGKASKDIARSNRLARKEDKEAEEATKVVTAEQVTEAFGEPVTEFETMSEARANIRNAIEEVFNSTEKAMQVCIASQTGTGKTTAVIEASLERVLDDSYTGKIVIGFPLKDNVEKNTLPNTALGRAMEKYPDKIKIRLGRNYDEANSDWYCGNATLAKQAGEAGHSIRESVCEHNCDLKDTCAYMSSVTKTKLPEVKLLVATNGVYLNHSSNLATEKISTYFCDESITPYLTNKLEIGLGVFDVWGKAIKHYNRNDRTLDTRVEKFLKYAELAYSQLAVDNPKPKEGDKDGWSNPLYPFYASMERVYNQYEAKASLTPMPFKDFLVDILDSAKNELEQSLFYYESAYHDANDRLVMPLRATQAFIEALVSYPNSVKAQRATAKGDFEVVINQVNVNLISNLRNIKLVNLDATLPPSVKDFFPEMKEVASNVKQYIQITQIDNALYTTRDLRNPVTRDRLVATVQHLINIQVSQGRKVLVCLPKEFEFIEGVDNKLAMMFTDCKVIHWGQHKSTNEYQDYDDAIAIGHYMTSLSEQEFQLGTRRDYGYAPKFEGEAGTEKRMKLYNYRNPLTGKGEGQIRIISKDKGLQAEIDHDYASNLDQFVGRLRSNLRQEEGKTTYANLFNISGEPVQSDKLVINTLTTIKELGKMTSIASKEIELVKEEVKEVAKTRTIMINKSINLDDHQYNPAYQVPENVDLALVASGKPQSNVEAFYQQVIFDQTTEAGLMGELMQLHAKHEAGIIPDKIFMRLNDFANSWYLSLQSVAS